MRTVSTTIPKFLTYVIGLTLAASLCGKVYYGTFSFYTFGKIAGGCVIWFGLAWGIWGFFCLLAPPNLNLVKVNCPQCGRSLRGATREMIGDTGVCPKCKAEFLIKQNKKVKGTYPEPSLPKQSESTPNALDHSKPTGVEMEKTGSKTRMAKVLAAICIVTLITIISIGVFLKYRERTDQPSAIPLATTRILEGP
ncbi:hypothetical protein ACFL5Z_16065 [Planctomycetota bacterium]